MPPLAEWITVAADFGATFTTLDWCEARQALDRATIVWDDVTYAIVDTGASWYYEVTPQDWENPLAVAKMGSALYFFNTLRPYHRRVLPIGHP